MNIKGFTKRNLNTLKYSYQESISYLNKKYEDVQGMENLFWMSYIVSFIMLMVPIVLFILIKQGRQLIIPFISSGIIPLLLFFLISVWVSYLFLIINVNRISKVQESYAKEYNLKGLTKLMFYLPLAIFGLFFMYINLKNNFLEVSNLGIALNLILFLTLISFHEDIYQYAHKQDTSKHVIYHLLISASLGISVGVILIKFKALYSFIHPVTVYLIAILWIVILRSLLYLIGTRRPKQNIKYKLLFDALKFFIPLIFITIIWSRKIPAHNMIKTIPNNSLSLVSLNEYTDEWIKKIGEDLDKPVFIMAGQGGGSRAGAVTYNHLHKLVDSLDIDFYNRCFAVTTISGSSNGTGFFLAEKELELTQSRNVKNQATQLYKYNYVAPGLFKLFFVNPVQRLFNTDKITLDRNAELIIDETFNFNRAHQLNTRGIRRLFKSIDDRQPTPILADFNSYYYNKDQTIRLDHPLFIPNSFDLIHGERVLYSPVSLEEININHDFVDLNKELNNLGSSLRLGQAVGISQSFPILNAVGYLDLGKESNKKYRAFYDGGVYDNYASTTLNELYDYLRYKLNDYGLREIPIIVISSENGGKDSPKDKIPNSFTAISKGVTSSIFKTHPETTFKMLERKTKFHNDTLIRLQLDTLSKNVTMSRWLNKSELKIIDTVTTKNVLKYDYELVPTKEHEHVSYIYFDVKSSLLNKNMERDLACFINDGFNPKRLKIIGFADERGDTEENLILSHERALAVKSYLEAHCDCEIPNQNIDAKGSTKTDCIECSDQYKYQMSRRVEVIRK